MNAAVLAMVERGLLGRKQVFAVNFVEGGGREELKLDEIWIWIFDEEKVRL